MPKSAKSGFSFDRLWKGLRPNFGQTGTDSDQIWASFHQFGLNSANSVWIDFDRLWLISAKFGLRCPTLGFVRPIWRPSSANFGFCSTKPWPCSANFGRPRLTLGWLRPSLPKSRYIWTSFGLYAQRRCVVCELNVAPIPVKFDHRGHSCKLDLSSQGRTPARETPQARTPPLQVARYSHHLFSPLSLFPRAGVEPLCAIWRRSSASFNGAA